MAIKTLGRAIGLGIDVNLPAFATKSAYSWVCEQKQKVGSKNDRCRNLISDFIQCSVKAIKNSIRLYRNGKRPILD